MMPIDTLDWTGLDQELALWQDAGLTLPLWWRDDDAITQTPALAQLTALAHKLALPVHLAVIPALADPNLAANLDSSLIPVVHGWQHRSHAPDNAKKAEFGPHRPLPEILTDAEQAFKTARELFEDRLRPMFVPPWNRVDKGLLAKLPKLGFTAVSTFTPRHRPNAAPGLQQINTHLDPIDWKGSRSLVAPQRLADQVKHQLRDRRLGNTDATEPYGILTHHLVHDAAIWRFTESLIARLLGGPAQAWTYDERTSA